MSNPRLIDNEVEQHMYSLFDRLSVHIDAGEVTYDEVRAHLRIGYAVEISDWFQDWWDEVEADL